MFIKEGEDEPIDVVWELLLHEMCSLSHQLHLQIRHVVPHLLPPYVLLNPRKFQEIVLSSHYQHHRDFNFRVGYCVLFMLSSSTESMLSEIVKLPYFIRDYGVI